MRTLLLTALACLAATTVAADPTTLAIGAAAPPFDLPGIDGKNHTLAEYAAAKVLVVIFTSNHCPTAIAYQSRLKALANDYNDKGVALVAINPNSDRALRLDELGYTDVGDSLAEMKIRDQEQHFNYPYLDDGETQAVAHAYGPHATPHAFVFDSERKLRYQGRIDDSEREELVKTRDLRNAIDALLAGREIAVKQTPAFGCSTKWLSKEDSVKEYMAKLAKDPVTVNPVDEAGLKELRAAGGKLRLINVWATTCGPCVVELPELVTISRMYATRPFELITIAANFPDERKEVLDLLTKNQCTLSRNLLFATTDKYKLMAAFDADWDGAIPYTLLIAPDGKVLLKVTGSIDPLALKRAIVAALGPRK